MMNADVEIGVIADPAGQVQLRTRLRNEMRLDVVALGGVAEQSGQPSPQCPSVPYIVREPVVQHRLPQCALPRRIEQRRGVVQIEDRVTDRDPDARLLRVGREDAKRQILDREIAMAVGAVDPARARRVMGFVEVGHAVPLRHFGRQREGASRAPCRDASGPNYG